MPLWGCSVQRAKVVQWQRKEKGLFFSELQEIFPAAAVHLSARRELKNKELSSTKVLKSSIYQRQKKDSS